MAGIVSSLSIIDWDIVLSRLSRYMPLDLCFSGTETCWIRGIMAGSRSRMHLFARRAHRRGHGGFISAHTTRAKRVRSHHLADHRSGIKPLALGGVVSTHITSFVSDCFRTMWRS